MSDLKALLEIEGIWARRLQQAEDDLRRAQARLRAAEQALLQAREALVDYEQRLPALIEQLYSDCIGHLVSRDFVQDKTHDEARLRARVAELKAQVVEAEKERQASVEAVQQAQAKLNKERVKLDAMRDLIKDERRKLAMADARTQAKALDDLSSAKFVRALKA